MPLHAILAHLCAVLQPGDKYRSILSLHIGTKAAEGHTIKVDAIGFHYNPRVVCNKIKSMFIGRSRCRMIRRRPSIDLIARIPHFILIRFYAPAAHLIPLGGCKSLTRYATLGCKQANVWLELKVGKAFSS